MARDEARRVLDIAWKAYIPATGFAVLAEEGPAIVGGFVLSRDVTGLGKTGHRIEEVRFTILGSAKTRGLVLINRKTGQYLVVFPRTETPEQRGEQARREALDKIKKAQDDQATP